MIYTVTTVPGGYTLHSRYPNTEDVLLGVGSKPTQILSILRGHLLAEAEDGEAPGQLGLPMDEIGRQQDDQLLRELPRN